MAKKASRNSAKHHTPKTVVNRRARFDYELKDELKTGIALTGMEVRAARDNHVYLRGAFVTIRGGELWLNNASFSLKVTERGQQAARTIDTRPRKLLAHKKEILALEAAAGKGTSIVPLRLITAGKYIKLVIALGKGKKRYDKRETIKRRDSEREAQRSMKEWR